MGEIQRVTVRHVANLKRMRESAAASMPTSREKTEVANLHTGKMLRSGKVKKRLLNHAANEELISVAKFAWKHPERLAFVRHSPLGEGKNLSDPADRRNVEKKQSRGVVRYNVYKYSYNRNLYEFKLEEHRAGFEQYYFLRRIH